VHFVGLFFVFIIENARSKKQNSGHDIFVFHELNCNKSLLNGYGHDKRLVKTNAM